MLNRDVNYRPPSEWKPDRSRPLQRKIAAHRERDLNTRSQYSIYDKMNDEGAFGLSESGLASWTGYRWDYSWEYWVTRTCLVIVMSLMIWVIRSCGGLA